MYVGYTCHSMGVEDSDHIFEGCSLLHLFVGSRDPTHVAELEGSQIYIVRPV